MLLGDVIREGLREELSFKSAFQTYSLAIFSFICIYNEFMFSSHSHALGGNRVWNRDLVLNSNSSTY